MQDSVSQDERVKDALSYETWSLGRDCILLDAAILAGDVIAIVYETPAIKFGEDENREIRTATHVGGQPRYSTIVSTAWSRGTE